MKLLTFILAIVFTGCITIQPCTCPQQPLASSLEGISMLPYYPPIYHPITVDTGFFKWQNIIGSDTIKNNHGWLISSDTLSTLIIRTDTTNITRFIK